MLEHSIPLTHFTKGKIKIQHANGRAWPEYKFHEA